MDRVCSGTGGALKRALPLLGDRFFVLYGDSYLPVDYRKAALAFVTDGKAGLMTVYRNEGRWDTSNVQFEAGQILRYDKKQPHSAKCITSIMGLAFCERNRLRSWPENEAIRSGGCLPSPLVRKSIGWPRSDGTVL